MASLKFYLLPADQCAKALELHALAKEDALSAKRELLSKYGADAILRSGAHVEALAWRDKPIAMTGFTVPKFDSRQGVWLQKPKKNTLRGKQAAQEMDEVGELLEIWQWSLERALGVHGSVFGYYHGSRVFLNAVARPLEDGRVVLSMPMRDKQDSERSSGADPVAPPFAVEISEVEAERMVGEPKDGQMDAMFKELGACGQPSWIDPSDQSPPPDYCHEIDHGTAEDRTGS